MSDTLHSAAELAGRLPALLLEAERVAHGFMRGVHGRRRVGQGEAFWQFRPYAPGDARRDIDWKQTARRDAPFVREMEWEAAQTLWLWRDASASMDFSSAKNLSTKKETAEVLLLALAMLALDGGEQVGLLGTDLAPQAHHAAAARLAEFLPAQETFRSTRPIAARSQVVLFSDFFFPLEEVSKFISSHHVSGLLVQLCDPAERNLPYTGRVRFEDAEGDGHLTLPKAEEVRAAYAEKFLAHQRAVEGMARANGWKFLDFSTDVSRETLLAALYGALAEG